MNREDYKIHIIGAGISGLVAAKTLEKTGYRPTIIEATDRVGGRVKTDLVEGYQLDHGFQVLLDAYPMAKAHLDYSNLQLQRFLPGAVIYNNGKAQRIGDPSRHLGLLLPTLLSSVGSVADKIKILKLEKILKKKSIDAIFQSSGTSTLNYLKDFGFSDAIIANFFKPFFTGIFLEPSLNTSSRMFEFVYKMFGQGYAVLPKNGIGAIPKQLQAQLHHTEFIFNNKVGVVNDDHILTSNGTKIGTHFTIIATDASVLIPNLKAQKTSWKSCYTLYFEVEKRSIKEPIIGLVAEDDALINNIFFHNSMATSSKGSQELLSVTVVKKHQLSEAELIDRVQNELKGFCNISAEKCIKCYHIRQALPNLRHLENDISPTETQLKPTIFLAGDHLLNGSLNAAMTSGERAAQGVIMALEDGLKVEEIASEYI